MKKVKDFFKTNKRIVVRLAVVGMFVKGRTCHCPVPAGLTPLTVG